MAVDKKIKYENKKPAMQGGGPNYLGKQKEVKVPVRWKSSPDHPDTELAYITEPEKQVLIALNMHGGLEDGKPNMGPNGIISLQGDMGSIGGGSSGSSNAGGSGNAGGDNYRDRIMEVQERNRKQQLKDLVEKGPGSDEEKYDTDLVDTKGKSVMTPTEKYLAQRNMIKSKYTATSDQRYNALTDNYTQEKNRLEKSVKGSLLKTLALAAIGIPPTLGNLVSFNPLGKEKFTGLAPDAYALKQLKNQHIEDLTSMKNDLLANVDFTNPNEMKDLEENTNFTEISQTLYQLTKEKEEEENEGRDDSPPVIEDIMAANQVIEERDETDIFNMWDRIKAKQAQRAMLVEKGIIQDNTQDQTMMLNSGGLANLFRVKTQ